MKRILFWLAFICLPGAAVAHTEPFRLKVFSNEINTIDGQMEIDLCLYAVNFLN